MKKSPKCPYCADSVVKIMTGKVVKPHLPQYSKCNYWVCQSCAARVGCHKDTRKPLGNLADFNLRIARIKAHDIFDTQWKKTGLTRDSAYRMLCRKLKLTRDECHIANFNLETCQEMLKPDWTFHI
jgi:hypothetical protein